jgi:hypothetical protein
MSQEDMDAYRQAFEANVKLYNAAWQEATSG